MNEIPETISKNYGNGVFAVYIDLNNYELEKNEELIVNINFEI